MKFWKMNGAGNDFIIINNIEEKVPEASLSELAEKVCDRHFSVGADGLMVVEAARAEADFRMVFYNSDGSIGEMCGNGARCIARYGFETGLSGGRETIVIEAGAGIVSGERISARKYQVRLNDPSHIELVKPLTIRPGCGSETAVETFGTLAPTAGAAGAGADMCLPRTAIPAGTGPAPAVDVYPSYILLGSPGLPHIVAEYTGSLRDFCGAGSLSNADTERLKAAGRELRYHSDLPQGANVTFYELTSPDEIFALTYERGVEDFTLACGTGAASATIALALTGRVSGRDVHIHMPGGTLTVTIEDFTPAANIPNPATVYISSPAASDIATASHSAPSASASIPAARGIMLTGPADIAAVGELF